MTLPIPGFSAPSEDKEIEIVKDALYALDPNGQHMGAIIRATYDQLLDGRRMGRWDYRDLHKTEKTYMGTLVEINIFKEFNLKEGGVADYIIDGVEVDCKYAKTVGGWEIGPELVGYICLVVTADDLDGTWRAGLVRASEENLRSTENRDRKRKLGAAGVASIIWLWGGKGKLAPNQLLHMDPAMRNRIMSAKGRIKGKGGQARINKLFEELQGTVIRRVTLETVGYGLDDPLKRARSNGGARDALRGKGILVLGHQDNDPLVARALKIDVPSKGEFISVRVVPAPEPRDERPVAEIEGRCWVVARRGDLPVTAPIVPRKKILQEV
ncbi:NaeI family type II restriction endonuclease [Streptomyces sp. NBC_00140]|uniref:NaeI family type II restriction endonuclease n=1 Tax=Streptomyces sp. NBC_00140 TaxID=2975664 RepID=UPI002255BDA5|nr:NaeI family type II restriction endonuclease [Streptomyces sp. NBC_00140]MCX5333805.1 NaeI family type II restriction endonuclease [Streptomyces sp. NBC_00140]